MFSSQPVSSSLHAVVLSPVEGVDGHWIARARDFDRPGRHTRIVDVWQGERFVKGGREFFAETFRDFRGRHLKAGAFDFVPFTTGSFTKPGEKPVFDGIEVRT